MTEVYEVAADSREEDWPVVDRTGCFRRPLSRNV